MSVNLSTRPMPPYREEAIHFQHGEVTLAGVLCLPLLPGPHPAVGRGAAGHRHGRGSTALTQRGSGLGW